MADQRVQIVLNRMRFVVEIRQGQNLTTRKILDPGHYGIGSAPANEIHLDAPEIAPQTARLEVTPTAITLLNLARPADLLVKGRPTRSTLPQPGSSVEIGPFLLSFAQEIDIPSTQKDLLQRLTTRLLDGAAIPTLDTDPELRSRAAGALDALMNEVRIPPGETRSRLRDQILDEVLGLGFLQALMDDPTVSEIMVNGSKAVFFERAGQITASDQTFSSDQHLRTVIQRIVWMANRRLDESSAMADVRLPDGTRANAVLPPIAIQGPMLTLRKHASTRQSLEDLANNSAFSPSMASLLQHAITLHCNIFICGGASSGKTTLLNAMASRIDPAERVITIEDSAELKLQLPNLCSLETRPANAEGKGEIQLRELVRNALRMRPDRIIVGECRGSEAVDMLQAMNCGSRGCLTTLHANSPRDALLRLETLVLMAGLDFPPSTVRHLIGSTVHLVVHMTRLPDGTRCIASIAENIRDEDGKANLQTIFRMKASRTQEGRFFPHFFSCGGLPEFVRQGVEEGYPTPPELLAEFGSELQPIP